MKIRQIGKALASAVLVPFVILGCANRYEVKLQELNRIYDIRMVERTEEEKIREKYRQAAFFFLIEGVYGGEGKTIIVEERGQGTVVGKEYITVEHWIDFPSEIEKEVDGKMKKMSIKEISVSINGRILERAINFRDWNDRAIYKIPKGLSWLENKLEMKDNVDLNKGDEVFWWGNPNGVFTETGKPKYCEARIAFLEGEYAKEPGFIGIDKQFIPGDSGSLIVKKKTGEIIGVAARYVKNEEIGLVIPASRYIGLKDAQRFKKENSPLFYFTEGFFLGDPSLEHIIKSLKEIKNTK